MKLLFWIAILLIPQLAFTQSKYPDHVGDIAFDAKFDDPTFKICSEHSVHHQYYNFGKGVQYKGEKPAIEKHFKEVYSNKMQGETGYITIRFVVNCDGKTGRFRVQEMNNNYESKIFNKSLVARLLTLTKQLNGWIIGIDSNNKKVDYYQYLTFKIENGKLLEILP